MIPFGNDIVIGDYVIPLQITTDVNIGTAADPRRDVDRRLRRGACRMVVEQQVFPAGGLRASAQMISYEIALGLSLVGVLLFPEALACARSYQAQQGHFCGIHSALEYLSRRSSASSFI